MNLVVNIKDLEGQQVKKLSIPVDPEKILYSRYLEFKHDAIAAIKYFIENSENFYEKAEVQLEYLQKLATACSAWIDEDVNNILHLSKGSEIENVKIILAIKEGRYDYESTKNTLYGLFGIIYKAIFSYTPKLRQKEESAVFIHNGKEYTIPFFGQDALGKPMNPSLTVAQCISILKRDIGLTRVIESMKDKGKLEKEMFRDVSKMALLQSDVPHDPVEIERYMHNMMDELKDINMVNGLDLCFFLIATLRI